MTESSGGSESATSQPAHGSGATMECPFCEFAVEYTPGDVPAKLAAEVDAEMHVEAEHPDEEIPSAYDYGNHQCPECFHVTGLEGTASCSNCQYIPEENRA